MEKGEWVESLSEANNGQKLPKSEKENEHPDSRDSEDSNQDGPKEAQIKTYYKQLVKNELILKAAREM